MFSGSRSVVFCFCYNGFMRQNIEQPFIQTLLEVPAIWIVSDIGYNLLLPILGIGSSDDNHPFLITAYYVFWIAVVLINFWGFYKQWKAIDVRPSMFMLVLFGIFGIILYLLYILPFFPPIHWASSWKPPSALLLTASQWYFLPLTIEIALQQLLVAAMVLAFNAQKFSLQTISYWSAGLFGSIHLLLVFNGSSFAYVAVFTVSAIVAGFIFPYLLLRVRNGFIYTYFLHWGFYAVVTVLARVLLVA